MNNRFEGWVIVYQGVRGILGRVKVRVSDEIQLSPAYEYNCQLSVVSGQMNHVRFVSPLEMFSSCETITLKPDRELALDVLSRNEQSILWNAVEEAEKIRIKLKEIEAKEAAKLSGLIIPILKHS